MSSTSTSLLLSLTGGLIALAFLVVHRGHPWLLACFGAAAIGTLIFFTLSTVRRLRREFGRRP